MYTVTTADDSVTQVWRMRFTSRAKSVRLVRSLVAKRMRGWGYAEDDIDTAVLVCSELSTNALRHGRIPGRHFEVLLAVTCADVLIEVSDASPVPPQPRASEDGDESGRGLQLVAELALSYGHHQRPTIGKTVWVHLELAAPHLRR